MESRRTELQQSDGATVSVLPDQQRTRHEAHR